MNQITKHSLAPRNAIDLAEAYRLFRGRDAKIEALMRDRGFPVVGSRILQGLYKLKKWTKKKFT
jgi:peptidyl-dipeptidase Dcp